MTNQKWTMTNFVFILSGDLKLVEKPQPMTLAPHDFCNIKANIKVASTENGIIFGNIGKRALHITFIYKYVKDKYNIFHEYVLGGFGFFFKLNLKASNRHYFITMWTRWSNSLSCFGKN